MKVVTFGELMIRLQPYNYERFVQADHLEFTFGGGEGKNGIGRPGPSTPWGKPALGLKTRKKNKHSNKLIVRRRDGSAIK